MISDRYGISLPMKITPSTIANNIEEILQWEIESIGVIIPKNLEYNIERFQKVLSQYRFPWKLHTVMKTNSSRAVLETGKQLWCRVDVSSYEELSKALSVWYTWENITANGPKNTRFLLSCIEYSVIIAVDSISELEELISLVPTGKKQKILMRISGFTWARSTRFWILREHWEKSIHMLELTRETLDILGYSFHIDKRDVDLRKAIFWESLEYRKLLRKSWFSVRIINIWGGYGVIYQDDTTIKDSSCARFHLGSRLYPQSDGPVWTDFLKKFLSDEDKLGLSIWGFLEENNIELWIEPGRSLMQNVGYGATRIIAIRHDGSETSLVLDTNSFSLGMREEELPTDPFLLGEGDHQHHEYTLLGNLCLESDIFFCRRIRLTRAAKIGDILIFPDIAAYHMDFYETASILHPKKSRFFQANNTLYSDIFL